MTETNGLVIDIGGFPIGESWELALKGEVSVPKAYCEQGEVPVTVKGRLERTSEDVFRFEGDASCLLLLKCDLCLTEFSEKLEFPIEGIFERGEGSEDDCRYGFSGDVINLENAVYCELLLNFPMKKVCKEDCKGLCIKCGANLNEGDCGCDVFLGNDAFLKLKEMFNEE